MTRLELSFERMGVNRKKSFGAVSMAALSASLLIGPTQVDAASARGSANATVLAPSVIAPSVTIVMPAPNMVARSGALGAPSESSAAAPSAGNSSVVATVAGVQVSSVEGGNALSFSMGGDTTSSYVLNLSSSTPGTAAAAAPSPSSSLIVAPAAMSGNGRLAIVLSQAPSELMPSALSLTVNFN